MLNKTLSQKRKVEVSSQPLRVNYLIHIFLWQVYFAHHNHLQFSPCDKEFIFWITLFFFKAHTEAMENNSDKINLTFHHLETQIMFLHQPFLVFNDHHRLLKFESRCWNLTLEWKFNFYAFSEFHGLWNISYVNR